MSRINFHKIEFWNFMSYGNYESSVILDQNKLTLIQGANGVGKTSILLALSYNLFGKTFNKAVKASLVNKKNKKGLLTKSWFSIGDDHYMVERGEKPSIFKVYKNDKELDIDGDSREFQKKFENEILNFDLKTFTRLICLGYDYIRFFELSAPERREFIESVLDLSSISDMVKIIKEYQKNDSDNLIKYGLLLNGKISNKNIYEQQLETLSKSNEHLIITYNNNIQTLTQDNVNIKSQIISFKNEYDSLELLKNELQMKLTSERNKILKINNDASVLNSNILNNNKLIEFFNHNNTCPTCHQNIEKDFSNHQLTILDKNNIDLNKKLKELKEQIDSINIVINSYEKDYKEATDKYNNLITQITSLKTNFKNNEVKIQENQKLLNDAKLDNNISQLKNNIENALTEINDYEQKIDKLKLRIEIYKTTLEILSETGVKKALVDNYIDIINQKTNEYLEEFGCSFDFTMDSEFNEIINLDFTDDVKYENLSAGQKQRLDLSIFLSFREIAQLRSKVSTNLLLLDEILDVNLDDEGVTSIIRILSKVGDSIYAISHNNIAKELCDNIINIEKKKYGFSYIS